MAKQVETVRLAYANGAAVTVAESKVATLLAQGFKKPASKPRQSPKPE